MRNKLVVSVVSLFSASMVLLAAAITPASAWNFWRHHHNDSGYYYDRQPVVVAPSVGIGIGNGDVSIGAYWASPQPGWHMYSRDWYYGHDEGWRAAHPYHPGPNDGFYVQF